MDFIKVGMLVEHRVWGRGKVLALSGQNVQGYFPSLESDGGGPVRLVREVMLMGAAVQSDPVLDQITGPPKPKKPKVKKADGRLADASAKAAGSAAKTRKRPAYDLERAIHWFEQEHPGGFSSEALIRDEIRNKRGAHELFVDRLGNGLGRALLDAGNQSEAATLLTVLYQSTNIPSRFEMMAAQNGLKVAEAGAKLLDALLAFLDAPAADAFARLTDAVGSLPASADGSRVLTWPNVTIMPFLADPSRFIVAKPEIFRQIARRMDIELLLSTSITWDSYSRVLDLSRKLLDRLVSLGATDLIDVQTFVWETRQLS
jgi:hypothetical protein